MQSTPAPPTPMASVASLAAAFADVPDPRRSASVTYPLVAILALAVSAILANHRSVLAIAEWGARQTPDHLRTLGFDDGSVPCQSTLQRLFCKLDGVMLAQTLTRCFAPVAVPAADAAPQGVAIDGKAQRGRLRFAPAGGVVHALTAFCHETGIVLAHVPITATGDKAEAELTVAPTLLARVDWPGRVLTGDALFCQRNLCRQVRDAGGDYLLLVKENQPALYEAITTWFDPPPALARRPVTDWRMTRTIDTAHGRRPEVRNLIASTDLTAWLDWPGAAQVFRVERTWVDQGVPKRALHSGITSLRPDIGTPDRLLTLKRGHWAIENRRHWRKDVTFGEDASLVHAGQGPTVMALLRDAAISLLHHHGVRQVAARLRAHSHQPEAAIAMVVGPLVARA